MNTSEMFEICKVREGQRCRFCVYFKQCKNFRDRHNGLKPYEYTRMAESPAEIRAEIRREVSKNLKPEQREQLKSLFEEVRDKWKS